MRGTHFNPFLKIFFGFFAFFIPRCPRFISFSAFQHEHAAGCVLYFFCISVFVISGHMRFCNCPAFYAKIFLLSKKSGRNFRGRLFPDQVI